jgi:hypothetical protein
MWTTAAGLGLLVGLATAVLPLRRARRLLLTALARLSQAIMLACLGACGTFFVQPEAAPAWAQSLLAPVLEGTRAYLPSAFADVPGAAWLALAVLGVAVSLPVLMLVELAAGLAKQLAQVQVLRKDVRRAAAWVDRRLTLLGAPGPAFPALPDEAAAATAALRAAGHPDKQGSSARAPLVIDLLK